MTIKEKEISVTKTIFETNKETFLNELYDNPNTKEVYYDLWMSCIKFIEENKQKDLYNFTSDEIEGIIKTVPTTSSDRRSNVFSLINLYCEWAVSKGLINVNPCIAIDRQEIVKINHKSIKKKMMSLNEAYRLCQRLSSYGSIFQYLPIILARYGIQGNDLEWMRFLKWDDIDYDKKEVHIVNSDGEYQNVIKVDDRFLEMIDKAKNTVSETVFITGKKKDVKQKEVYYEDFGYVLKKLSTAELDTPYNTEVSIYSGLTKICNQANEERPTFNNLIKSKKIDMLLDVRAHRKLTNNDIYDVVMTLNPNMSRGGYMSLKRNYESLTREKVYKANTPLEELYDENAVEFANKMRKEIFGE